MFGDGPCMSVLSPAFRVPTRTAGTASIRIDQAFQCASIAYSASGAPMIGIATWMRVHYFGLAKWTRSVHCVLPIARGTAEWGISKACLDAMQGFPSTVGKLGIDAV